MIIQTERLVLRPFCDADKAWYYNLVKGKEFIKRLPGLADEDEYQASLDVDLFKRADFSSDFYYVITDKENNNIGIIVAVRTIGTTIEVSYFLTKQYRHHGYMQEALKALVDAMKKVNPLYRIYMIVDKDNKESLNVVKKINAIIQEVEDKYICYV